MKILYVALKYDYGKKERGYSFEHHNLYDSLVNMENKKHEIIYFPLDEIMTEFGQEEMNSKLLKKVEEIKPNLCFFCLFTDEIYPETIKKITDSGITTYNWFCDDHWRFDNYSKYYAPNFSFISTTDSQAPDKYKKIGYKNCLKTQWACNHFLYKQTEIFDDLNFTSEVSFVGQIHSDRKRIITELLNKNIKVDCFGKGWPNGKISQEKMIDKFLKSKINLNLTKGSGYFTLVSIGRIFIGKKNDKFFLKSPLKWSENFKAFLGHQRDQIKGRNFEIPGCGGFLITSDADNLKEYYQDGKEIVVFKDTNDLINKIKYYLDHEEERKNIALAGYQRTINEHTYEKRFQELFKLMGF